MTDHMLFGTPGTLLDWILRHRVIDSKKINMFVMDDADVMIAVQGNQDQCIRIHKSVNYHYRATVDQSFGINFSWKFVFSDCHFFALLRKRVFAKFGIQTLHLDTRFLARMIQPLSVISRSEFYSLTVTNFHST